jgi:hypothetical protein
VAGGVGVLAQARREDNRALALQERRAEAVVAREKTARTPRFVKARARRLEGLKGYVTNISPEVMPAGEVIGCYHALWQVERRSGSRSTCEHGRCSTTPATQSGPT